MADSSKSFVLVNRIKKTFEKADIEEYLKFQLDKRERETTLINFDRNLEEQNLIDFVFNNEEIFKVKALNDVIKLLLTFSGLFSIKYLTTEKFSKFLELKKINKGTSWKKEWFEIICENDAESLFGNITGKFANKHKENYANKTEEEKKIIKQSNPRCIEYWLKYHDNDLEKAKKSQLEYQLKNSGVHRDYYNSDEEYKEALSKMDKNSFKNVDDIGKKDIIERRKETAKINLHSSLYNYLKSSNTIYYTKFNNLSTFEEICSDLEDIFGNDLELFKKFVVYLYNRRDNNNGLFILYSQYLLENYKYDKFKELVLWYYSGNKGDYISDYYFYSEFKDSDMNSYLLRTNKDKYKLLKGYLNSPVINEGINTDTYNNYYQYHNSNGDMASGEATKFFTRLYKHFRKCGVSRNNIYFAARPSKEYFVKDGDNKYFFDFYVKDFNLLIEFDGILHYEPIYGQEVLEYKQKRDKLKDAYAANNGFKLYRFYYKDSKDDFYNMIVNKYK